MGGARASNAPAAAATGGGGTQRNVAHRGSRLLPAYEKELESEAKLVYDGFRRDDEEEDGEQSFREDEGDDDEQAMIQKMIKQEVK